MRAYCAALLLAAAVGCRAQTDSAQANRLAVGLNLMTHGETCGGGLPRSGDNDMQARDIRAWMVALKATVRLSRRYDCIVGYDCLSGDDFVPFTGGAAGMSMIGVERGFNPLYGSRTKFYGIMDYFYESAYVHGFTPGLQNAFVGACCRPSAKFECTATYHYLATAADIYELDRPLGHSVELTARYRCSSDITLSLGYTQMHGTETMARLKQDGSSSNARWGWLSLTVAPSLFTTKW